MKKNALNIVVLVFIQILFGFNFITSKYSLQVMDPFSFAAVRFLVAGLVLLVFAFIFSKKDEFYIDFYSFRLILASSIAGITLGQALFMWGLDYSGAMNASIISVSIPLFTLLISYIRNQVTLNKYKIMGIAGAFLGVLLLKSGDIIRWNADSLFGDVLLLAACFSLGIYISLSKDLYRQYPVVLGTALNFIFGGAFLVPLGLSFQRIDLEAMKSFPYLHSILFSILGGTLLTYFLNNWVIRKVDPLKLSLFIYLQPIVTGTFAYFLFEEKVSLFKIFASIIIFGSVLVALKEDKAKTV